MGPIDVLRMNTQSILRRYIVSSILEGLVDKNHLKDSSFFLFFW